MKKTLLIAGLAMSLLTSFKSQAQVHVSLSFGTPVTQQSWYARDNDYYYIPEQGVYYNTRRKVYVYPENGAWYTANRLPERYGRVTYRNTRYVRVRDRSPFDRDNDYRQRYHGNDHQYNNGRHDNGNHDQHDNGRHDNGNRGNDHQNSGNHYGHENH